MLITPNPMANNAKLAFSFSCCATFTYRKKIEFVALLMDHLMKFYSGVAPVFVAHRADRKIESDIVVR